MKKNRVATLWLDGCSGCHMSLLDMDERLVEIAGKMELVYCPLMDCKVFPEDVDVTLVEGAVSTEEDRSKLELIRKRTRVLASFGDCAVTANIPGMRNRFKVKDVLTVGYIDNANLNGGIPQITVPRLLPRAQPVHEFVAVDLFIPGCPPPADAIFFVLSELLEGRTPDIAGKTRFGA
jgi:NAD-reducing hydrogenase small subunit